MRCDLENMLRQVQEAMIDHNQKGNFGPYIESIRQLREHINQVRNGTATLEEFAEYDPKEEWAKLIPEAFPKKG